MLKLLYIILFSLGGLLLLTGMLFRIMHWPDLFIGYLSGPVFIIAGGILFAIHLQRNYPKEKRM